MVHSLCARTFPIASSMTWRFIVPLVIVLTVALAVDGQVTYDSGSTGADGAFNPTTSTPIQIPPSGVFNFTTVNIPAGIQVTFIRNAKNTSVTILASGNVTIAGTILLDGTSGTTSNVIGGTSGGGIGGPGGFDGGRGGTTFAGFTAALSGNGPGSGGGGSSTSGTNVGGGGGAGFVIPGTDGAQQTPSAVFGKGGLSYGSSTLIPLIGGSGGGGGGGGTGSSLGMGGGGGGGAIFIASSGTITLNSSFIRAQGGSGNGQCSVANGGGGAGGAVRIAATTITGAVQIQVNGGSGVNGCSGIQGGNGSNGAVRIEAFNFVNFSPNISGAASSVLSKTPNPPGIVNPPQLNITSVAGVSAPASPSGMYDSPDIILSPNQSNPVTAQLTAANVPLNSTVKLILMPEVGAQTVVQATPLTGTLASATASASLTLGGGTTRITATVVIDLTAQNNRPPIFMNGERVNSVEVTATFGGKSETTYITQSGRRIKESF